MGAGANGVEDAWLHCLHHVRRCQYLGLENSCSRMKGPDSELDCRLGEYGALDCAIEDGRRGAVSRGSGCVG